MSSIKFSFTDEAYQIAYTLPNLFLFVLAIYGCFDLFTTVDPSGIVAMYGMVTYSFRKDAIYPPSLAQYLDVLYGLLSLGLVLVALVTLPKLTKAELKLRFALSSAIFMLLTFVLAQRKKTGDYNTTFQESTGRLGLIVCFGLLDPLYRLLNFDIKKELSKGKEGYDGRP